MKHTDYITWAKQKKGIRYNLARSGVPGVAVGELVDDPAFVFESGTHEDGWPPLMEAVAARYEVEGSQVVLALSATMANHLAMALFAGSGGNVLMETPGYEPLEALARFLGFEIRHFSRRQDHGYQPDPDEIARLADADTRLVVLTDLHNPSGRALDDDVMGRLLSFAERRGIRVLVDEVYLEFRHPEGMRTWAFHPSVLATRSLTKCFGMDDLRVGWILAEASTAQKLRRLRDLFATTMPFPSERLGLLVLRRADELLQRAGHLADANRGIVDEFIGNHPQLTWMQPTHGSIGFVRCQGTDVDALAERLERDHATLIAPGRFFGDPEGFRIGWGMPKEDLKKGLENLAVALKALA